MPPAVVRSMTRTSRGERSALGQRRGGRRFV